MRSFLEEVADQILETYSHRLQDLTFVFPNRRASLYFKKILSERISKPVFSPRFVTIEEFFQRHVPLEVPEKLELVYKLYEVVREVTDEAGAWEPEPFDQFYFWGEMLLRDFDEMDRHLVNPVHLFQDLREWKELETLFDYMSDEQKEFLRHFWVQFKKSESVVKDKFMAIWNRLYAIYSRYREKLAEQGLAYMGMLQREVAEALTENTTDLDANQVYVFLGYNALTKVEERLIATYLTAVPSHIFWDIDAYYVNNDIQEAGYFFRKYQAHPVFGKTFPKGIPAHLHGKHKQVKIFAAAQPVGQAKLLCQVFKEELDKGMQVEHALVVLPDEKVLLPLLYGIAESVGSFNVTMGYPLSATPVANLAEELVDLHLHRKESHFNHRHVTALLGHPYVVAANPSLAQARQKEIIQHNQVYLPVNYVSSGHELYRLIFCAYEQVYNTSDRVAVRFLDYLYTIFYYIGAIPSLNDLDREYVLHFIKLINRLKQVYGHAILEQANEKNVLRPLMRLFRQLLKSERLPFTGEPLSGLQIMGMLESRNLDFKNVFVLSLNEGIFPAFAAQNSYLPYHVRKAYQLPTPDYQDAISSYLFYRLLQRAENIFLFYNSEPDVLGQGEKSRYLRQLMLESNLHIEHAVVHNTTRQERREAITIEKDALVLESLSKHLDTHPAPRGLTPSSLNDYLECRLKFYFRYVAGIKEPRQVEEDMDARVVGSMLHQIMEAYYMRILEGRSNNVIHAEDLENYEPRIREIIDALYIRRYHLNPSKEVVYAGQALVVKEVVKIFVDRILELDRQYAPFSLEGLEQKGLTYVIPLKSHARLRVLLGGVVDRIDVKQDTVRVVDYKTGKDRLDFVSLESLFERTTSRNKAAFQTLTYALLYARSHPYRQHKIQTGLLNRLNLFEENFQFGLIMNRQPLDDVRPLLEDFEVMITALLEEIFDPLIPFDQTPHEEVCRLCPYHQVCHR